MNGSYILWRTFDPDGDPTYKKTWTDRAIQLRSQETHTETQYSPRYSNVSASATLADGCGCQRFKMIDYTKHPKRWKTIRIPCTKEQEDLMFDFDCKMADYPNWANKRASGQYRWKPRRCYWGHNAKKYDRLGVVLCNISHRRILGSSDKLVWCTESRIMSVLQAFPDLTDKHPDTFRPDNGHKLIQEYFK